MEMPRRVYRRGEQIGYYIGPQHYEPEDDGVCIRTSTVIFITDDYRAGNCRVCGGTLPTAIERVVCLNCLGEQSSLALIEVSNSGNLLEYLLWKQRQQPYQETEAQSDASLLEKMITTGHVLHFPPEETTANIKSEKTQPRSVFTRRKKPHKEAT